MPVESLVKATVELQGFRVARVTGDVSGPVAMIEPPPVFCTDRVPSAAKALAMRMVPQPRLFTQLHKVTNP